MDKRRAVLSNPRADYFRKRRAETKKRELKVQEEKSKRIPENQTTAYKVFNNTFELLVEKVYLHSDEEIEGWGMRESKWFGDSRDLEFNIHQEVNMHLPISDLLPLFLEGARPRFVKLRDSARAYDVCVSHLEAWVDYICRPSINYRYIPWSDLYALDEMAAWLFSLSRNELGTRADEIIGLNPQLALQLRLFGQHKEHITDHDHSLGYIRTIGDEHEPIMDDIPDHLKPDVDLDSINIRSDTYELQ